MKDYSNLVPENLCPKMSFLTEHGLLYLGRETILFLSDYWKNASASRMGRAISNGDMDDYLENADEAQECRKKSKLLADLASSANAKPCVFNIGPFTIGDMITCFVQDKTNDASGRLIDAVVMDVEQGEKPVYLLRPYKRLYIHSTDAFRFAPDNVSVFLREDVPYYRHHPNFLRTTLTIRATSDAERDKIEAILAAFSA